MATTAGRTKRRGTRQIRTALLPNGELISFLESQTKVTPVGEAAAAVRDAMMASVDATRDVPAPQLAAERAYEVLKTRTDRVRILDLGAGPGRSEDPSPTTRNAAIGSLAKRSATRQWVRRLLYDLVIKLKPRRVLELGTALGSSTLTIACALSELPRPEDEMPRLVSVEGSSELVFIASKLLLEQGIEVSREALVICSPFDDFLEPHLKQVGPRLDLAFVDGLHTGRFMIESLRAFIRECGPGTVLVYDDLLWSERTASSWKIMTKEISAGGGSFVDLQTVGILILGAGRAS